MAYFGQYPASLGWVAAASVAAIDRPETPGLSRRRCADDSRRPRRPWRRKSLAYDPARSIGALAPRLVREQQQVTVPISACVSTIRPKSCELDFEGRPAPRSRPLRTCNPRRPSLVRSARYASWQARPQLDRSALSAGARSGLVSFDHARPLADADPFVVQNCGNKTCASKRAYSSNICRKVTISVAGRALPMGPRLIGRNTPRITTNQLKAERSGAVPECGAAVSLTHGGIWLVGTAAFRTSCPRRQTRVFAKWVFGKLPAWSSSRS